ncbi:MAG: glycerophosphodiester phosphodiesterase [Muribaculum sp.]|nr:glycerophosphodiester phosphodiesterase [Muribaculaceae bacterium]MCM1080382.1 glycerophosphodiester phosphodiesterase [Muribaculum sp.]
MKAFIASAILASAASVCMAAQPKVIAHRGFWTAADSAQNSVSALVEAAKVKCYGAELDVHSTVDGVLVVFHDNNIGDVRIQDTTYGNIQYNRLRNGEYLPTLIEYFQVAKQLPDIKLILEVKPHRTAQRDRQVCSDIVKLVNDMGLAERTEYISFSLDACRAIHELAPQAKVAYLGGGLTPVQAKEMGLTGIDYHYSFYDKNPGWISQANDLGLEVNVWTIDGDDLLKKWNAVPGVDLITTDQPARLIEIQAEK